MQKITFITSYLTFYLKGEIGIEENFLKLKVPNTILGLIPLGKHSKSIAINQISSVDNDFRLLFKQLIIGIIIAIIGFSSIGSSFVVGLFFLAIGVLDILNSFQTVLIVTMTSGQIEAVPFIIFEKAKATKVEEEINGMIAGRLDDTNNRKQTDRIVDAINKK